jgi:hypothetical protein
MAKLNMAKLFTVFLLMVIGLALTPTVVEQVGYVTGTGGDNLTGASIGIFSIALSVSVRIAYSVILGYHYPFYWCCKEIKNFLFPNKPFIHNFGKGNRDNPFNALRHFKRHFDKSIGRFNLIFSPAFYGVSYA